MHTYSPAPLWTVTHDLRSQPSLLRAPPGAAFVCAPRLTLHLVLALSKTLHSRPPAPAFPTPMSSLSFSHPLSGNSMPLLASPSPFLSPAPHCPGFLNCLVCFVEVDITASPLSPRFRPPCRPGMGFPLQPLFFPLSSPALSPLSTGFVHHALPGVSSFSMSPSFLASPSLYF